MYRRAFLCFSALALLVSRKVREASSQSRDPIVNDENKTLYYRVGQHDPVSEFYHATIVSIEERGVWVAPEALRDNEICNEVLLSWKLDSNGKKCFPVERVRSVGIDQVYVSIGGLGIITELQASGGLFPLLIVTA